MLMASTARGMGDADEEGEIEGSDFQKHFDPHEGRIPAKAGNCHCLLAGGRFQEKASQEEEEKEVSTPERVKATMKRVGLSGVNKPKATPNHKTKSHVVMAKEGDKYKLLRFGQQGVKGAGKNPKTKRGQGQKEKLLRQA